MVNDMKKKERLKYIRIVLLFLIFLAVFFPWVCMGNESFTILEFYRKITANDVLTETVQNGAILQLLPYFLIFRFISLYRALFFSFSSSTFKALPNTRLMSSSRVGFNR